MSDPERAAYAAGLALLARRDLSERQVRERLARRDHSPEAIDAAVERLRAARAIDDRRVARSAARVEAEQRSRGRLRVIRKIESLGISHEIASEAVRDVFGELDERALLDRAIARRLRGASPVLDAARFRRLHQQLLRQGFSSAAIVAALKARAKGADLPDTPPDLDTDAD